jgi:hypothetical protein
MLHAALSLALLLSAPTEAKRAGHPDVGEVGSPDACLACHAEATPEVVKQWEAGPHGLVLVKCFVCHGSVGKDFTVAPGIRRCEGCHPAEFASVAAARGAGPKVCFDCHSPHELGAQGKQNPHPAR